jgi:hypothetical protein
VLHHLADLDMPWLAADSRHGLRGGQARCGEEHAGQFLVGVLTGVQQPCPEAEHAHYMRKFYYFRASPDDCGNMWVLGIFPHLNAFNRKGGKTRGLV